MNTQTNMDFSMRSVPEEWHEAADEAPETDNGPLRNRRSLAVMPRGEQVDLVTSFIAAITMSVVAGTSWYLFETRGVTSSPLLAVLLAALIALSVRLGGGAADPEVRATISGVFYMAAIIVGTYFIERYDFRLTYGITPDLTASQEAVVRDRLSQPEVVIAWTAGLVLAMQLSYWTAKRK